MGEPFCRNGNGRRRWTSHRHQHQRKFEIRKLLAPVLAVLQESGAGGTNFSEHIGADIEPLEKAGVPAFSPIQDSRFYFNYHHTTADTLDKIAPKELAENSAVVAVFAHVLSNSELPLPRE